MKIETIPFEVESCGECSGALYSPTEKNQYRQKCSRTKRVIPDLWGEIPSWCPLPDKNG